MADKVADAVQSVGLHSGYVVGSLVVAETSFVAPLPDSKVDMQPTDVLFFGLHYFLVLQGLAGCNCHIHSDW